MAQPTTSSQQAETLTSAQRADANLFLKEGEYWTLAYEGRMVRLRDIKGMHCLALLLSDPGKPWPAVELMAAHKHPQRSTTCSVEQARVTVTKRIKMAVVKIQEHHPSLGHHLATCVKTGTCCTYSPNPAHPLMWRV